MGDGAPASQRGTSRNAITLSKSSTMYMCPLSGDTVAWAHSMAVQPTFLLEERRLSHAERTRMTQTIKRLMESPKTRSQSDVDRELRQIRKSRRTGWIRQSS